MKKAHELSVICNLNVNITFYDLVLNKIIEFATKKDLTLKELGKKINVKEGNGKTN